MLYPPNEAQNASKVDGYKSIYAIIWPDKCAQLCQVGYGVWNSVINSTKSTFLSMSKMSIILLWACIFSLLINFFIHVIFQNQAQVRDHSSITWACYWIFLGPPTYVSINSTVNQQKLPFSDPTYPLLCWRNNWMVPKGYKKDPQFF